MNEHTEADDTLPDDACLDTLVDLDSPFADVSSLPERPSTPLLRPRSKPTDGE